MARREIAPDELNLRAFHLWDKQWMLLTSGDFGKGHYNAMTVGWGSIGVMWNKPFAQVVVRPTRFTYEFMEKYDTFTLSAFPEDWRSALKLLGSASGRDGDKITESGLVPMASQLVAAPSFEEAELTLECRKIYWDDMDPSRFLDGDIEPCYPERDYHRIYFGEILRALGEDE